MRRHILPSFAVLWVVCFIGSLHSYSYAQSQYTDQKLIERLSRIEDMIRNNEKRIEGIQDRLFNFMGIVIIGFITVSGIVTGLILWDRKTMSDKIIRDTNQTMNDTVRDATARISSEVTASLASNFTTQMIEVRQQIQELKNNIDERIDQTNRLLNEAKADVQAHIFRIEDIVDYHGRVIRRDYEDQR